MRGISSKLVTVWPSAARASLKNAKAFVGSARPTKAVARERGLGNSFNAAAVMIPSVPSAPMKRFFKS